MIWLLLLLVCAFGVLAAAATEVALIRFRELWSPRRRVFTAAVTGPAIIVSPLVFSVAAMLLYPGSGVGNLPVIAIVRLGVAAGLAAFVGGLVVAFAIERSFQP